MKLETSKKILKISGIFCVIGAIIISLLGVLIIVGGIFANSEEGIGYGITPEMAKLGITAGIAIVISGILYLIEGIVSILASKENRYGTAAFIFALISVVSSVCSGANTIRENGFDISSMMSVIIGIVISGLVCTAASKVKETYKLETK